MRRVRRYVSRNWLWIVAGLILKEVAVKSAYEARGYLAYGGEWLILPLILMLVEEIRGIGNMINFLLGKESYEPDRD